MRVLVVRLQICTSKADFTVENKPLQYCPEIVLHLFVNCSHLHIEINRKAV